MIDSRNSSVAPSRRGELDLGRFQRSSRTGSFSKPAAFPPTSLRRGVGGRALCQFCSASSGFARRVSFCYSWRVAGGSFRSWRRSHIRTPIALLDTSIDIGRELLEITIRNVRQAARKDRRSLQQIAALKREVVEALAAYSCDRSISFPAEVLIVSGRKKAGNGDLENLSIPATSAI